MAASLQWMVGMTADIGMFVGFAVRVALLPVTIAIATLTTAPIALAQDLEIRQLEEFLEPEPARPPTPAVAPVLPAPVAPAPVAPPPSPEQVSINTHRPGTLGRWNQLRDGFYQDLYSFEGTAGESIAINVIGTSDPRTMLDPLIRLLGPGGEVVAEDDNGGSNPERGDARLVLELPETGTYILVVTTATPGDKGRYALSLGVY